MQKNGDARELLQVFSKVGTIRIYKHFSLCYNLRRRNDQIRACAQKRGMERDDSKKEDRRGAFEYFDHRCFGLDPHAL